MLKPPEAFDVLTRRGREQIIADYRIAYRSRQISLIGRREVLSGRAKFGIFGDGKEIAQLAMAHAFRPGDWRSGYYRDQTFMLALGAISVRTFFAQLYAHPGVDAEPASGGRQMNAHFATTAVEPDGSWRPVLQQYNSSSDVSPTGSQMPRLVGLGYASKLYRALGVLPQQSMHSNDGNEIAFGTIGNASCAEGLFWEALNAIGVLRVPVLLSIWDDGYGISVPNEYQIVKQDLSTLLAGFVRDENGADGYDLYTVRGWDYPALMQAYTAAAENARRDHVPAVVHVIEMTQPQGHSTSGSHERYKSPERLEWEETTDPIRHMRQWMLENDVSDEATLATLEKEELAYVRREQQAAFKAYNDHINTDKADASRLLQALAAASKHGAEINRLDREMRRPRYSMRRDIMTAIHRALLVTRAETGPERRALIAWRDAARERYLPDYSSHLTSESDSSPSVETKPVYAADAPQVAGFTILNRYFDGMFARRPDVVAFGEDLGYLGGVNQAMAGLQSKYGVWRVSDTGIREATIVGQAIGLAMRGFRPIAEIQYLDYVLYALQIMSDDLATLRWRTVGQQKAPVIIRTRGHRLEGIWHAGSPMGSLIHLLHGMHICVPRDMTQAAAFYNTLLAGDDPGMVVEVLNGYRKKEPLPENLGDITIPLGVPEIVRSGRDVTLITYGAMVGVALEAAESLATVGIDVEVIDVRTLLPFDREHMIADSLRKTNRLVCADEDVPGGASAYMLQQVLEVQGGYHFLDSEPRTLTGSRHRPPYGTDGAYFSIPNAEDIFAACYALMHEADPAAYPPFLDQ